MLLFFLCLFRESEACFWHTNPVTSILFHCLDFAERRFAICARHKILSRIGDEKSNNKLFPICRPPRQDLHQFLGRQFLVGQKRKITLPMQPRAERIYKKRESKKESYLSYLQFFQTYKRGITNNPFPAFVIVSKYPNLRLVFTEH